MAQHATAQGTAAYRRRFDAQLAPDHFRTAQGWSVSSIGLGTYLGDADSRTDASYRKAIGAALQRGCNLIEPPSIAACSAASGRSGKRSPPGVTTALVGMKQAAHVEENLALGRMSPASPAQVVQLFRQTAPAQ